MSFDFSWLLVGVFVLIGIGIVIRARLNFHDKLEARSQPRMFERGHQMLCWIVKHSRAVGWLAIGFILGSYAILVLEKFGSVFFELPAIIYPLRG